MVAIPDEVLMAYADGELNEGERLALEKLLEQYPELRQRLEPFLETRLRLQFAFGHVVHEPVPERHIAAIMRAAAKTKAAPAPAAPSWHERALAAVQEALATTFPNGVAPLVAAGAAGLLLVTASAGWIGGRVFAPAGLIAVTNTGLVASGPLENALETLPSGMTTTAGDAGSIKPVLSFRAQDNAVCREYRIAGTPAAADFAGLACRDPEGVWRLALHVETPKPETTPDTAYQTATSGNVPAVDALSSGLIAGDAFGRDDEAALLANGWQTPEPVRPPL